MKYGYIILLIAGLFIFGAVCSGIYISSMSSTTPKELQNASADIYSANITIETTTPIVVTPTPEPTPSYVTCSNYKKIVDKWKTPSGSYVQFEDNTTVRLTEPYNYTWIGYTNESGESFTRTFGDTYFDIHIGEYAIPCKSGVEAYTYTYCTASLVYGKSFKLEHVPEKESGYRDACIVVED